MLGWARAPGAEHTAAKRFGSPDASIGGTDAGPRACESVTFRTVPEVWYLN